MNRSLSENTAASSQINIGITYATGTSRPIELSAPRRSGEDRGDSRVAARTVPGGDEYLIRDEQEGVATEESQRVDPETPDAENLTFEARRRSELDGPTRHSKRVDGHSSRQCVLNADGARDA